MTSIWNFSCEKHLVSRKNSPLTDLEASVPDFKCTASERHLGSSHPIYELARRQKQHLISRRMSKQRIHNERRSTWTQNSPSVHGYGTSDSSIECSLDVFKSGAKEGLDRGTLSAEGWHDEDIDLGLLGVLGLAQRQVLSIAAVAVGKCKLARRQGGIDGRTTVHSVILVTFATNPGCACS